MGLVHGEFDLDGLGFGCGHPVSVGEFDPGVAEWTVQDADNPTADGSFFGRDYLRGPSWTFGLDINQKNAADAFEQIGQLASKWREAGGRGTPGRYATLRYGLGGRTRRVYGRPRRWAPNVADTVLGQASVTADFALVDPMHYDDTPRSTSISLVVTSTGGWVWPTVFPISTVGAGKREGVIDDVGGEASTPFVATISGPIADPYISGPGFTIELNTTLAYDRMVTIDTRPWVNTVTLDGGGSLGGALSRESRLSKARLSPGSAALVFGGTDATRTATCTVTWWPAYWSL